MLALVVTSMLPPLVAAAAIGMFRRASDFARRALDLGKPLAHRSARLDEPVVLVLPAGVCSGRDRVGDCLGDERLSRRPR